MSQVTLNVKRVIEFGSENFGIVCDEVFKAVQSSVDAGTGELMFNEVDTSTLILNKKYLQGWLNANFPGIAYLYGKRKEEGKSISHTDLTVFLRDAKLTVERYRYTEEDTYLLNGEETHYNGVTWRSEMVDLEFSAKVAPKIEALEDKAFEI
jgi:hypothetical protein